MTVVQFVAPDYTIRCWTEMVASIRVDNASGQWAVAWINQHDVKATVLAYTEAVARRMYEDIVTHTPAVWKYSGRAWGRTP